MIDLPHGPLTEVHRESHAMLHEIFMRSRLRITKRSENTPCHLKVYVPSNGFAPIRPLTCVKAIPCFASGFRRNKTTASEQAFVSLSPKEDTRLRIIAEQLTHVGNRR